MTGEQIHAAASFYADEVVSLHEDHPIPNLVWNAAYQDYVRHHESGECEFQHIADHYDSLMAE